MASRKKRPPLAWDGKKPLKMKWLLYYKGKIAKAICAYDIEARWFKRQLQGGTVLTRNASFLVKRLD